MDHSLANPCGSTIRNQTIRPPKIISSACEMPAVEISMPNRPSNTGRNWFSAIGSTTMKAAPKKLPMIEPRPPMITMNSRRNDWSTEKAAGSQAPR